VTVARGFPSRETGSCPAVVRPPGNNCECIAESDSSAPEHITLGWLKFKVGRVPALIDTGAQFSCVRSNVVIYLSLRGEDCTSLPCSVTCLLADGSKAQVKGAVRLHVRLLSFSWDHKFKILNDSPFPAILGMDFLRRTQMRVDVSSRTYCFGFAPCTVGSFSDKELEPRPEPYLQQLCREVADFTTLQRSHPSHLNQTVLMNFPPSFPPPLASLSALPMT